MTLSSGTTTFTGNNSYNGVTTVNGGMLQVGASSANALSPNSDLFVGTNAAAATLDISSTTTYMQTVKSLTIGSLGSLNESIGVPLVSLNNVTFNAGSTINISGGTIGSTPILLMAYGGSAIGTFTNVYDNGLIVPATELHYSGGLVQAYIASSFSGSGTWIGTTSSWNTAANWNDVNGSNGVPGDGTRGPGVDTATFSGSGPVTAITLDISPNLAALSFNGANYTIVGPGTLTMQQGTTGLGTSTITVANGAADDCQRRADFRRKSGRPRVPWRHAGHYRQCLG